VTHSTWVDITLDNITKHIELLLVTECVRDVEILIGQNFTELADIDIDITSAAINYNWYKHDV
jgi:hypothetical protein